MSEIYDRVITIIFGIFAPICLILLSILIVVISAFILSILVLVDIISTILIKVNNFIFKSKLT
nr:MAG TPA: hypothetical protein [Caudoviricetes sp.]